MIVLAATVAADEDALVCDLAQFYGIFDYKRLPLRTVATLTDGLPLSSRTKTRMVGITVPLDTFLLAMAIDNLSMLCWLNSEDGAKGKNKPEPITEKLRIKEFKNTGRFADADSFEAMRLRMLTESPKEGD